jgi:NhaP-type Na+/H+ or K+/H+ antiporter
MYPQEAEFRLTEKESAFFASLVFLLKTYFFIFIGISMDFSEPLYLLGGAGIALALLGLRWLIISFFFKWDLPKLDKFMIKTMGPKGLTEAALLVLVGNQFLSQISHPVIMFSIIYTSIIVFYARHHFRVNAKLPEKEK